MCYSKSEINKNITHIHKHLFFSIIQIFFIFEWSSILFITVLLIELMKITEGCSSGHLYVQCPFTSFLKKE